LNYFDEIFLNCPACKTVTMRISNEFYQLYKEELFGKERFFLLDNICKIIGTTEFNTYDKCSNNCQTPVADIIYDISKSLRDIIASLPPNPILTEEILKDISGNQIELTKVENPLYEEMKIAFYKFQNAQIQQLKNNKMVVFPV